MMNDTAKTKTELNTGEGILEILKLKPAGKKEMDDGNFINGYHVRKGNEFLMEENKNV